MKKIFAILMTICLLAGVLSITAFAVEVSADEPAAGTVLRISAQKNNSLVVIDDYDNFQDGWNDAMEIAGNSSKMEKNGYERIVVDIYADWKANKDGEFTEEIWNGDGFDNDTIYIPANAKITLNMNDHTIDRHLTKAEDDGEVMFINDKANVIINNGTIKGGYSNSEGGGLYIEGGANITLNNVNIDGNAVKNDDGAAIYMYGGATLTMNGGSISNNLMDSNSIGMLYTKDSTVALDNVIIDGNYTKTASASGLVIYATKSTVKMNKCTVSNNATKGNAANDFIYVKDSNLTVTDTDFTNNNTLVVPNKTSDITPRIFYVDNSPLTINGGKITKNGAENIFYFANSKADFTGTTITDNASGVMSVNNLNQIINMTECALDNNTAWSSNYVIDIKKKDQVVMTDCILGNTSFSYPEYVKVTYASVSKEKAVIGISGILADGTTAFTDHYKNFAYGWNMAINSALSNEYNRIVVDLYDDWIAEQSRFADSFTNGKGFYKDAIYIPENARIILNLNGHTINRALGYAHDNGEVILIDKNAEVIINEGTIRGGHSNTGAGGIHINGGAKVTLNNVSVYRNKAGDSNGSGIAVLDGAILTMNGGRFAENDLVNCGTLYVNASTAILNNVTMTKNWAAFRSTKGSAIYAIDSTVKMNGCDVPNCTLSSQSIIEGHNSEFTIENTSFTKNSSSDKYGNTYLFFLKDSNLTMKGCKITGNRPAKIFSFEDSEANIHGVTITDNESCVLDIKNSDKKVVLTECTLDNNIPSYGLTAEIDVKNMDTLEMVDCSLGDTEFKNKDMVTISNKMVASIFGEGSLTMIVVTLVLVISGITIFHFVYKKKKKVSATITNAEEAQDEE